MFAVGDKVNWKCNPTGGYGYSMSVAGVVEQVSEKRVRIRVAHRIETTWVLVSKWVLPEKLTPREKHVEQVDG